MSNKCKTLCIDEGMNFCSNSNYSGGYCCKADETCPKVHICSLDNPRAPAMFKYLACPNESACESKNIYPSYSGEVLTRTVNKYKNFVRNDVCSYIIHTPDEMSRRDSMKVRIKNMENVIVFLHKQPKGMYRHFPHLDAILDPVSTHPSLPAQSDVTIDTRKGWTINVIGVGQNTFKGNFRMEIWIENNVHPASKGKTGAKKT